MGSLSGPPIKRARIPPSKLDFGLSEDFAFSCHFEQRGIRFLFIRCDLLQPGARPHSVRTLRRMIQKRSDHELREDVLRPIDGERVARVAHASSHLC